MLLAKSFETRFKIFHRKISFIKNKTFILSLPSTGQTQRITYGHGGKSEVNPLEFSQFIVLITACLCHN